MHAFLDLILDINDLKFPEDQQLIRCEEHKAKWLTMQRTFNKQANVMVFPNFSKALNYLGENNKYNVLVTGSIHLVGVVMSIIDPTLGGVLED